MSEERKIMTLDSGTPVHTIPVSTFFRIYDTILVVDQEANRGVLLSEIEMNKVIKRSRRVLGS